MIVVRALDRNFRLTPIINRRRCFERKVHMYILYTARAPTAFPVEKPPPYQRYVISEENPLNRTTAATDVVGRPVVF